MILWCWCKSIRDDFVGSVCVGKNKKCCWDLFSPWWITKCSYFQLRNALVIDNRLIFVSFIHNQFVSWPLLLPSGQTKNTIKPHTKCISFFSLYSFISLCTAHDHYVHTVNGNQKPKGARKHFLQFSNTWTAFRQTLTAYIHTYITSASKSDSDS